MSNKLSNLIKFIKEDKEHKLSMVPQGIEIWFCSTRESPRFRYMAKDEVEAQFILDILEGYDRSFKEFLQSGKDGIFVDELEGVLNQIREVESSYGIRVFNSDTNNWADLIIKGGMKIRWADKE